MPIERECLAHAESLHQSKRNAIGKAHFLIGELGKVHNRVDFISFGGTKDSDGSRQIEISRPLGRERITCPPRKQRQEFVNYEIAGRDLRAGPLNFVPVLDCPRVMLILSQIARQ